jgi:opacity protein-like surface antigen
VSVKRLIAAIAVMAALVLSAMAAAAVTPKVGTYQGTVNGTITTHRHNEGEGYFDLKVVNGKRKIVAHSPLAKILAPSDFKCHQLNAYIEAPRIPVNAGAFIYSGTAPIAINHSTQSRANRHIVFKGHWTNSTNLVGSTKVSGGGCKKTVLWKMKTPPPPGSP